MQKKTRFKSPLRDALVVSLCLGLAACFLFLFWRDLNRMTTRGDKDRVATISFKNRIAQRKFSDRVVWERVSQNAPVYNGDIIRTADLAQATVHFDNGAALNLYENTMIQILVGRDGEMQISIDGGDIQVESAASEALALVLDDGSKVTVDAGASLAAKAGSAGTRSVEVKNGSAQVESASGESARLTTGEAVSVESSGEIQKRPVTVTSVPREMRILHIHDKAPADLRAGDGKPDEASALASGGALPDAAAAGMAASGISIPIRLAWAVAGEKTVTVETAAGRDFASLTSHLVTAEKETELSVSDGTLYWRVYTEDEKEQGAQGKITVESLLPLEGLAPAAQSNFIYRERRPRINFRWSGNPYVTSYELLVSTTPDMRSPVFRAETAATFLALDQLEEGSYYWQVRPAYSLQHVGQGFSPIQGFALVRQEKIRPPELSVPADGARLLRKKSLSQPFIWKSDVAEANYRLLIASDQAFSSLVLEEETESLRLLETFDEKNLSDGRYYWKIIRQSKKEADRIDDSQNESQVRSFTLAAYVPQEHKLLFPPEDYRTELSHLADTSFVWKLGDDCPADSRSLLQIADNPDFASPKLEREAAQSSLSGILLDPGRYWWRVGLLSPDGGLESATPGRSFSVLRPLDQPAITSPQEETSLLSWRDSPVSFAWQPVAGSDYYDLQILDDEGRLVASRLGLRSTESSLVLPPAHYTLRVEAVGAETPVSPLRRGEAGTRSFSVRRPDPLVTSWPAADSHIPGLTALRKETVFRWQQGKDSPVATTFLLFKQEPDGSLREVERVEKAESGLSLSRLPQGSYRWALQGSTREGLPLDSAPAAFTVDRVLPLEMPRLLAPAQDLLMDFAYLRKNRTITFSWQAVAGATDYSFTLYRREAGGSLTPVMTERRLKATSVTLKKLKNLTVGDFLWTVGAASHAADGFEEQVGKAASGSFRVSFDRPKKVEIIQPEPMYAQ